MRRRPIILNSAPDNRARLDVACCLPAMKFFMWTNSRSDVASITCLLVALTGAVGHAAVPTELTLVGDWEVKVVVHEPRHIETVLKISPPALVTVMAEKFDALPVFNPNAGGWVKGAQLRGVQAQETTTPYLVEPESLILRAGPEPDSAVFRRAWITTST